ncbi:MAG: DUF2190 family protein [Bacteroidetes bacterium]|nr:DUF2190 family protein [Bacteroidota bacterium]
MALSFAQTHSYHEQGFGIATVRCVVTNDVDKLFDRVADHDVDVLQLDNVARDLNISNGSFAVDAMELSIDAASLQTQTDHDCLAFFLGATDVTRYRFVAVFMNPTYTADPDKVDVSCLLFVGRVLSDVSADDQRWYGSEWSPDIDPMSTYKFNAHSFDITALDTVKLPHLFVGWWADETMFGEGDPDIAPVDTATIDGMFANRVGWLADDEFVMNPGTQPNTYAKFYQLGNMYSTLVLLLTKTGEILAEKLGFGTYTIDLIESDLGYETCPVVYEQVHKTSSAGSGGSITYDQLRVEQVIVDQSQRVPVEISADADKGIMIHKRMVVPVEDGEKGLSWHRNGSVSDLLFDIARTFGLYVSFKYISANHIEVRFISRAALVEADETYIRDSTKGSRNISSLASESSDVPIYEARSGNWSFDGADVFFETNASTLEPSQRITNYSTLPSGSREKSMPRIERLLHSHSWPMIYCVPKDGPLYYDQIGRERATKTYFIPANTIFSLSGTESNTIGFDNGLFNNLSIESLSTSIYRRFDRVHALDVTQCNLTPNFYRPCAYIFAQVNGENVVYETLSDYVNALVGRDAEQYLMEYEIDVPFWNGFSKNADGASASWSTLRLGSRIKLNETVRVLDETTNVFSDVATEREYVVIGIKYDLKEPKTTLKLQRRSRFAFASYDGDITAPVVYFPAGPHVGDGDTIVYEPGEAVNASDVVYVGDDGLVYRAEADQLLYDRTLGVALQDATTGDLVSVQHTGRVYSSSFSFIPGRPVFLRTNDTGTNLSQTILLEKNGREDLFACMGSADSSRSFIIDIRRYILDY